MRQVGNIQQQIALPFFRCGGLPDELSAFVANQPDPLFQLGRIFASSAGRADLFAQPFPIGVALLERGFHLAPLGIDRQHLIDLCLIAAAPGREPALHKVRLFTNEADIEHGQELSALRGSRKRKPAKSA